MKRTSRDGEDERHRPGPYVVERLPGNPIITPDLSPSIGTNINGPSLIEVPAWLPDPLGRYYLYFAHHKDTFVRLAYADDIAGPWRIYEPGTLRVGDSHFIEHIASPDVHVDHERREIRMYFHGLVRAEGHLQASRVAVSDDGLSFAAREPYAGGPYLRVFEWQGWHYAWGMGGLFYRSPDGIDDWLWRATLDWPSRARHGAVLLEDGVLTVFFTRALDAPERILCCTVELTDNWNDWTPSEPMEVLEPETEYEGADLPVERSKYGAIHRRSRQLRDPAVFVDVDDHWLLYSVAGESAIAAARLLDRERG